MKIGFLAQQVGGTTMHKSFYAPEFAKEGHEVVLIGREQIDAHNEIAKLFGCDVVCIDAMYSKDSLAVIEVAEELQKRGIPRVLIEGAPGQYVNMHDGRSIATVNPDLVAEVFACTPASLELAKNAGADASFQGYPLNWRSSMNDIRQGSGFRSRLAIKRHAGNETDVLGDKILWYYPGQKSRKNEDAAMAQMLEAAKVLAEKDSRFALENLVFPLRPHPGEKTLHTPQQLADSDAWRAETLGKAWTLAGHQPATEEKLSNAHIVGASDITVFGGGPTESLTLMMENNRIALNVLDAFPGYDANEWEPVKNGSIVATNLADIRETLLGVLQSPEKQTAVLANQKKFYPAPASWDSAKNILSILQKYAKR